MTKPTGNPRGRPRKTAVATPTAPDADATAAPAAATKTKAKAEERPRSDTVDDGFLELKLLERDTPKRRTKLEADPDTLRSIFLLAKLFCTQEETAGFLGVGRATFQRFLYDNQEAKEAWEDGQQHAKISLRRKQLARCDKSDTMNIFLGKNYLDQRDEKHQTTQITHTVEELTEAQLREIAAQAVAEDSRPALH